MIDKLVKEFEKIRSSLTKSKKLILSEIDKIDDKYRKLAEEEKKSLMANLSAVNDQLKYFDNMLGGTADEPVDESTDDVVEEPVVVEEPEMVVDTIYQDNNVQEGADDVFEQETTDEPFDPVQVVEEAGFKEITESTWEDAFGENMDKGDSSEDVPVEEVVEEATEPVADTSDINEEWPMPEKWV